jgi:hypothetical protein
MDKLMDRQALYKTKLMRLVLGKWYKLEIAMDALRTPDADTPIKTFQGRASSCSIMSFVVATAWCIASRWAYQPLGCRECIMVRTFANIQEL